MEKKKIPVSTVIFYIIGIVLLAVAAFMLWTSVNYTKTYLISYDAAFKDMWSNTVQYVIAQFVPYLGMGVICLGIGRAIYGTANARVFHAAEDPSADEAAETAEESGQEAEKKAAPAAAAGAAAISTDQMDELIRRIDTNREVLSIKIEEKEKRDSFRIKELEKKVEDFLTDVKYINEPLEELVYKQAAGIDDEDTVIAETDAKEADMEPAAAAGPVPQIFRVARNMAMPACIAAAKAAAVIPQVFRVTRGMTMPACPAAAADAMPEAGAAPQIFTVSRRMTMPACPAAAADAMPEAGAVPQIFTVSRRMTMPKC